MRDNSFMKAVLYAAALAVLTYAALCALLYLLQDRLLYLRTAESARPGAGVLRLKCGNATLKVWELHREQRAAVIYFGGNAEDVSANLADFAAAFPDRAVYLVNYRGYGGSTGSPSEAALIADAESIYDWVSAHHDRIAVLGRSLGSGVATALATRRPLERWLLRDRYDSLARIGMVRVPVLAVVAEDDEVVLRARSDALIAAIPQNIRHVVMIGAATHNDISSFPAYLASLRRFLAAAPASS